MKQLIVDCETDGLNPTVLDCVVTIDVDTEEVNVWRYDQNRDRFCESADVWIGHNILGYDAPVLRNFGSVPSLTDSRCIDTLVCSRLFNQQVRGGHSLHEWGIRLGDNKSDFTEFARYEDPDLERDRMDRLVKYCIQDCRVTLQLYRLFRKHIEGEQWRRALRVEHDMAVICRRMHEDGYPLDVSSTRAIKDELTGIVQDLSAQLREAFPRRSYCIREIVPKSTKFGTLHRGDFRWLGDESLASFTDGAAFSRVGYEEFNPGSPKQVIDILNKAGWKPFEKTDGYKDTEKELRELLRRTNRKSGGRDRGLEVRIEELKAKIEEYKVYGWKISEENLETLPEDAPEACNLFVKWRMLSQRLRTCEEWLNAYNPETGTVNGDFLHIGTWTHRMAHSNPNMGNPPSVDSKYHNPELKRLAKLYGTRMRSVWVPGKNKLQVGVDAEGIQLRILAHYMNDAEFTEALISGRKEDDDGKELPPEEWTDVHTLNAIKLGFDFTVRPRAKTFIYAWLLGAGLGKVAKILGITLEAARVAVESFISGYPGLSHLKSVRIPADAKVGYFESFDGRLIRSDEYHMLAGYLQTGEQAIMKTARIRWGHELDQLGIPYQALNLVHDEFQTAVPDDIELAEEVASVQMKSIVWAGEQFGLNCPMAGSRKIGHNWMDCH